MKHPLRFYSIFPGCQNICLDERVWEFQKICFALLLTGARCPLSEDMFSGVFRDVFCQSPGRYFHLSPERPFLKIGNSSHTPLVRHSDGFPTFQGSQGDLPDTGYLPSRYGWKQGQRAKGAYHQIFFFQVDKYNLSTETLNPVVLLQDSCATLIKAQICLSNALVCTPGHWWHVKISLSCLEVSFSSVKCCIKCAVKIHQLLQPSLSTLAHKLKRKDRSG